MSFSPSVGHPGSENGVEWGKKKNSEQGREKGTAAAPSKYQKNFSKASNYIVLGIVYMFWTLTKLEVDQKFS